MNALVDMRQAVDRLTRIMDAPLTITAPAYAAAADQHAEEAALRDRTPIDTGLLESSTGSELAVVGRIAAILLTQPAKVRPNKDDSGGGYNEWPYVVYGHGEVDAPARGFAQGSGRWPSHTTGKPFFASELKDFGPAYHIRAVEGVDYPHLAMTDSRPGRIQTTRAAALTAAMDVLILGG